MVAWFFGLFIPFFQSGATGLMLDISHHYMKVPDPDVKSIRPNSNGSHAAGLLDGWFLEPELLDR